MLHQKIFVPYIILFTARLSLFHTETLFSPLKYIVYRCYSCFRQRRGHFFHRHTCIQWLHSFSLYNAFVYTCHAFLVLHQKIFVPYIILFTARLSLFHTETLFSPLKYIVYRCYSCFRQRRAHIVTLVYSGCIAFPYIMHCIHLSRFFGASSENICPIHYIVHSSSQSVSHRNSVFSFKIHCLQMLQLFQTKKGSIFSSSHLYTVVA